MERARAAVKDFMSKSGQHHTDVHETHHAAITRETVNPTHHERATTAVDREIHQDHHHTTILPINHSETLPEQHHHNFIPVEHKRFEHDNAERLRQSLEDERSQFFDTSERAPEVHTNEQIHAGVAEHVHHHVHEHIQPVVHKTTVEPHIIHTVIPIHEIHHNETKHHSAHTLSAISMEDFLKNGGALKGGKESHTSYTGAPKGLFDPNATTMEGIPTESSVRRTSPMRTAVEKRRDSGASMGSDKKKVSNLDPGTSLTDAERGAIAAFGKKDGPLNSHKHSYIKA